MRRFSAVLALALTMVAGAAAAQPSGSSAPSGHYSTTTTTIGALLDDPAAKAVLVKHVPEIATSDQIDSVRSMTLKDVQQFAPDKLSDKQLADIDAELAKLPAKQ
jgi:para-nitrobenzyl esterase